MPPFLCVTQFEAESGLAKDRVQVTTHFRSVGAVVTVADVTAAHAALLEFWHTEVTGLGGPLDTFLSARVSRAPLSAKFLGYGAAESPLGDPVLITPWTPSAAGSSSRLPGEVAAVLSYQSNQEGLPLRRRRGRMYLGPFIANSGGNSERPQASTMALIRGCASRLLATTTASGVRWVTYSRVGNADRTVDGGFTDDAWDTQRRRGVAPTARTNWS